MSHRKNAVRQAVRAIGRRYVIANRASLTCVRQSTQSHRPCDGGYRPTRAPVGRRNRSDIQPARGRSAVRNRIRVIGYRDMRAGTGGASIPGDARDEVIDSAVYGVNRDAHFRGPGCAVGRGAHHDIVRRSATAEAGVLHDDVHLTRAIYFSREQCAGAQAAGRGVVGNVHYQDTGTPSIAAER